MQGSANLNIMIKAARKAGRSLVKDFREVENLQVSAKGPGDFVTKADIASHVAQLHGRGLSRVAWCGNAARSGRGRKKALRRDFGAVGGPPSTCGSRQRADRTTRPAGPGPIPPPELIPPALRSGGLDTGC